MRHIARTDDQHSLLAQRPELLPDPKELVRIMGWHAQLQNRDVGVRIHHFERDPRTMIKTTARMLMHPIKVRHQRSDLCRQRRGIGCLVCHLKVPAAESAEVIDQSRPNRWRGQRERSRLPMGAHDQDRSWLGQGSGPAEQLIHPVRIVENWRSAVTQVKSWHAAVSWLPPPMITTGRR